MRTQVRQSIRLLYFGSANVRASQDIRVLVFFERTHLADQRDATEQDAAVGGSGPRAGRLLSSS
jgi:hypothetical protein